MSDSRRLAQELYEIRALALSHATSPQVGSSSVDGDGLVFRDGDGNDLGRIGGGEDGMEVEYLYGPKPNQPSAPIVSADANLISVRWDGLWVGGEDETDPGIVGAGSLDRVEVHVSSDEFFVPDPINSFAGVVPVTPEGGVALVGPLAEAGDWYVVLMARGKDGQYGAPSERVHVVTTVGLMENELFGLALRAGEAMESADGKNSVYYGDEEPQPTPRLDENGDPVLDDDGNPLFNEFTEGDIWFGEGNMPHVWSDTGGWVSAADQRVDAIQSVVDELEGDLDAVRESADGKSKTFYRPTEPPASESSEGDLWFDTSAEGGNRAHRFTGGVWVSVADQRVQAVQDAMDDFESDLDTVRATADGKNRTFYQSTMPATPPARAGDLWFNTANGYRLHRNNGATFIEVADGRIADLESEVENIDISGPLSEARTEWLADAAADAQTKAQNAAAAAEAAAKLYADAVATGAVEGELEGIQDYADQAAEQARQAAITAAIAEARVIANEARDEALAAALDADAVISQSIAQFESDLDLVRESADGKSKITWSPNAPSGDGKAGDTWFRTSSNRIIGYWRHSGSGWVSMSLDATVIPNLDAGKIASGTIDAGRIKAGSITADKIAAKAITSEKITAGAVGATAIAAESIDASKIVAGGIQADSLIVPGTVGSTLIKDGAITTSKIEAGAITAQSGIIASLDAGVISSGFIDSARIRAGSISADKVLIGNTTNLVPDPGALGSIHDSWMGYGSGSVGDSGSGAFWRYAGTTQGYRGVRVGNTEGAFGNAQWLASSKFQVKPGESYLIEVIGYRSELVGGFPRVGIRLGDIDDNYMGETETVVMDQGGFTTYSAIVTIPNDLTIKYGRLRYTIPSSITSGYGYFFSPVVRPAVGSTLIEGGAVTTEKIATGAITAESGVIGSLDAGKIVVGEMDGARIKAGTIQADKILVGGAGNLLTNPGFTGGGTGWNLATYNPIITESGGPTGEPVLSIQHSDSGGAVFPYLGGLAQSVAGSFAPDLAVVEPGKRYAASVWVRAGVDIPVGNAGMGFRLRELGAATLGWALPSTATNREVIPANTWAKIEGEFLIPEDTGTWNRLAFGLRANGALNGQRVEFSAPVLLPKVGATLIEDGAITTEHIRTGAITAESGIIGSLDAGVITTGELRGELIRAGSIAASALAATAIDGKTITGATVRTAAAGARVEMNSSGLYVKNQFGINTVSMQNGTISVDGGTITGGTVRTSVSGARVQLDRTGLKAWNPSNVETFSISANTGTVSMTGDLFQTNDYGDIAIGPSLFLDASPSLRFRKHGESADGDAGITLYDGGGRSALLLYSAGGQTGSQGRSVLQLPHGESTGPAGLYRYKSGSTIGNVRVNADGRAVASSSQGIQLTKSNASGNDWIGLGYDGGWGSQGIYIRTLGDLTMYMGRWAAPNINTGSGTDLIITSSNYIGKKSSSRRYKIAEEPIERTLPGIEDALLGMEVKTWFDRRSAERLAEAETEKTNGIVPLDDLKDVDPLRRIPGVVAEDLDAAGLGMFVVYNEDGSPESVMYDRLGVALVPAVKALRDRVNELEEKIGELWNG